MVTNALAIISTALSTQGIPATADPTEVNPPGAWLAARTLGQGYFDGSFDVNVDVYLIVGDNGTIHALTALEDLLAKAMLAFREYGLAVTATALDQGVTLPAGGGPLPSFMLSVQVEP